MTWPLFQSSLSSTPFSGTLADTSTETPAGALPQTPQANEAPGVSGNRARAEKLQSQDVLNSAIDQERSIMQHLEGLRWSNHPNSKNWNRRLGVSLNGNRDVEPPEMMYKRYEAIAMHGRNLQSLLEEQRLGNQLSPFEQAYLAETGKNIGEQQQVVDRQRSFEVVNARIKEQKAAGLIPLDTHEFTPDEIAILSLNPTANVRGKEGGVASPEDLVKQATASAAAGRALGPGGIDLLPSNQRPAARAGYKTGRAETTAQEHAAAEQKRWAGFASLQQLRVAVDREHDNIAATLGTSVELDTGNPDPYHPERNITRVIHPLSPEQEITVRGLAISRVVGASEVPEMASYVTGHDPADNKKRFPPGMNFGPASQPTNQQQKDLTPDQIKSILKARKPKAK